MPRAVEWKVVLDRYETRMQTWKHPNASLYTMEKLPPYIRAVVPLTLSAELPSGRVLGFGFDIITPAPESVMKAAFTEAMQKANSSLESRQLCAIAHAYVSKPFGSYENYPGSIHWVGGLIATRPLVMATGINLGQTGQVLNEIAYELTNAIRNRGYLAVVNFADELWNYHISNLELAEGVITTVDIWKPEPQQPEQPRKKLPWWQDEKFKWIIIGAIVLLLLVLILKR